MTRQPAAPHRPETASATADAIASHILAVADRDLAFVVKIAGDSQHALVQHFHAFIEAGLRRHGVAYGDHPLLRPMIETHARELADFVQNGIGLKHQFGLRALEQPGDALALLRVDLWDSLRSHIGYAERHVLDNPRGLPAILAEVEAFRAGQTGRDAP